MATRKTLDIDDMMSRLLVTEGFSSIEDILYASIEDLKKIEGFDEDIANELKQRATIANKEEKARLAKEYKKLKLKKELIEIEGMNSKILLLLGEKGICTRDNLGDLASDELIEIIGERTLDTKTANDIIMRARAHWFKDEEKQ